MALSGALGDLLAEPEEDRGGTKPEPVHAPEVPAEQITRKGNAPENEGKSDVVAAVILVCSSPASCRLSDLSAFCATDRRRSLT